MKNIFYIIVLFSLPLFSKEPSAFEAGNIESPNPYGLTTNEKYILKNKKNIEILKKESLKNSSKIRDLQEKVEGLRSVVEGIDTKINELKIDLKRISETEKEEYDKKFSKLNEDLNKTISLQKENFDQIKKVLNELTSLIDSINSSYVSKDEFKKEIDNIYTYIDKKFSSLKKESIYSKSGASLFNEARKLYKAKKYDKAKEYFLVSIKKRYKPATSNFYVGEICYYQKDYNCAIEHYKKSASLYSKSSFMPTLMLHTAISLERIGQKDEAKLFYKNLIKKFPKSKAASIAKKNLKKI